MNRHLFNNFGFARGLTITAIKPHPSLALSLVNDNSELNRLLSLVYAPLSKDELPQGDIATLMSEKVDPQLVNFIKQNLMFDVSQYNLPPIDGIPDDDMVAMCRKMGESKQDYAMRLSRDIVDIRSKLIKSDEDEN